MSCPKSNIADPGYQYLFKLVLAGSSGVGKTSMLMRYVDKDFSATFISTIGVDFKVKTEDVSGARVKLQMWDTAGQDRFRSVASNFYRCADAIIIVFDVCRAASFADVEGWVAEARRYGPSGSHALLVGNKADSGEKESTGLERQVGETEARDLASRLGMNYLETSAKTGHNVEETFTSLAKQLVAKRREENGGEDPTPGLNYIGGKKGAITLDGNSHHPVTAETPWCWGGASCSTF